MALTVFWVSARFETTRARGFIHGGNRQMLDYVSPVGKLAEFFRSSRDRWKARSAKSQQKIKALDGNVRDLTVSRDAWKAKANDLKRELEDGRRADE